MMYVLVYKFSFLDVLVVDLAILTSDETFGIQIVE